MIAFSGLDGAGKSTQIDLLAKIYSNNKYKSLVFWSRGGYTPGMKFLKNTLKVSKKTSKSYQMKPIFMLKIYLLIQMFKNLINSSLNLDKFSAQS
jgi:thymidylate kinase